MNRLLRNLRTIGAHLLAWVVVGAVLSPMLLVAVGARPFIVKAFSEALRTPTLTHQLMNSALLSLGIATVCAFVAPGAGYALSLQRLPFRRQWIGLLVAVAIAPITLVLVPAEIIFTSVSMRDSLWSVGAVQLGLMLPLGIAIMMIAFEGLPANLMEVARFEGASPFRVYRSIALPLVRRAQGIVWAGTFALSWGESILSSTFLSRPSEQTLMSSLVARVHAGAPWEHLFVPLLVAALPPLLFLLAVQYELDRWVGLDRLLAPHDIRS